jgi:hypothetical protein
MESDYLHNPLRALKKSSSGRSSWFKKARRLIAFFAVVIAINTGIFASYTQRHIANGVYLGGESVAGLSEEDALSLVKKQIGFMAMKRVVLQDGDFTDSFLLEDAGFTFDEHKTVMHLFKAGRGFWGSIGQASLMGNLPIIQQKGGDFVVRPYVSVDEKVLREFVFNRLKRREVLPVNPELVWSETSGWGISFGFPGRTLKESEVDRISNGIVQGIYKPDSLLTYVAEYAETPPDRRLASVEAVLEQVRMMEAAPLNLEINGETQHVYVASNAPDWFGLDYEAGKVSINEDYVRQWVDEFSEPFYIPASEVTVVSLEEIASDYKPGRSYKKAVFREGDELRSGESVNTEFLFEDTMKALNTVEGRFIEVRIDRVPITIHSDLPGIEFPHMLGPGGTSRYPIDAAHKERAHNVENAIDLQNLTVLAPGESSSYNTIGGWVTYSTGYVDGEVIFGNVLRKVPGGGVCQSSTTMYRSLLYAGMQIDYSRAHSWRVHYYDDFLGPEGIHQLGLDASVYPPGGLDVSFTNTTPGHVLVHSWYESEKGIAHYDLYGTDDGRKVIVDPAPEDTRRGRGSTVVRNYTIEYPDGTVDERQRVSNYMKGL